MSVCKEKKKIWPNWEKRETTVEAWRVCVCDVRENNFVWKWGSAGEYFFPQIFKKKIINLSNIRDKRIEWGNQKIKKSEYRGGRSKGDWDRRYFFFNNRYNWGRWRRRWRLHKHFSFPFKKIKNLKKTQSGMALGFFFFQFLLLLLSTSWTVHTQWINIRVHTRII